MQYDNKIENLQNSQLYTSFRGMDTWLNKETYLFTCRIYLEHILFFLKCWKRDWNSKQYDIMLS